MLFKLLQKFRPIVGSIYVEVIEIRKLSTRVYIIFFVEFHKHKRYSAAVIGWQRGAATNVRSAAPAANHRCAVGLLTASREFRLLKLILHSELRRRQWRRQL